MTNNGHHAKTTMRASQLHRIKQAAAWKAARGDLVINGMMEQLHNNVIAHNTNRGFGLHDAAWIIAAIGQLQEFRRWIG